MANPIVTIGFNGDSTQLNRVVEGIRRSLGLLGEAGAQATADAAKGMEGLNKTSQDAASKGVDKVDASLVKVDKTSAKTSTEATSGMRRVTKETEKTTEAVTKTTKARQKDEQASRRSGVIGVQAAKSVGQAMARMGRFIASATLGGVQGFRNMGQASNKANAAIQKGANNSSTALGGLARKVAAVAAAYLSIKAGAGFAQSSIEKAADLESLTANIKIRLGNDQAATDDLLGNIREFANKTPFEMPGLAKAAQQLLQYEVTLDEIMPTIKMLGDISGGNAEQFKSLTLAFSQMNSAGRLNGQDLLQMVNAGFNPLNAIAKKTGESMAQLRERMSAGKLGADEIKAAFKSATEEGGLFFQNMLVQSKTWNGLLSTIRGKWTEIKEALGTPIINALKPFLESTITRMDDWIAKAKELGKTLGDGIRTAVAIIHSGALGKFLEISLKAGGARALNFLGGMLVTVIGTTVSIISNVFKRLGDPNFWSATANALIGMVKMLSGSLSIIGGLIMEGLRPAITVLLAGALNFVSYVESGLRDAGYTLRLTLLDAAAFFVKTLANVGAKVGIDIGEAAMMDLMADRIKLNTEMGNDRGADRFETSFKDAENIIGGLMDPAESVAQGSKLFKEGAAEFTAGVKARASQLQEDVGEEIVKAIRSFQPANIVDASKEEGQIKAILMAIAAKLELEDKLKKEQADAEQAAVDAKKKENAKARAVAGAGGPMNIIADSLAKIGGGGRSFITGGNSGSASPEEAAIVAQTPEIKAQTQHQAKIVSLLERANGFLSTIANNTGTNGPTEGGGSGVVVEF